MSDGGHSDFMATVGQALLVAGLGAGVGLVFVIVLSLFLR